MEFLQNASKPDGYGLGVGLGNPQNPKKLLLQIGFCFISGPFWGMTSTGSNELPGGLAGRLGGEENHQTPRSPLFLKGFCSISGPLRSLAAAAAAADHYFVQIIYFLLYEQRKGYHMDIPKSASHQNSCKGLS